MDEPTAALSATEVQILTDLIHKDAGAGHGDSFYLAPF